MQLVTWRPESDTLDKAKATQRRWIREVTRRRFMSRLTILHLSDYHYSQKQTKDTEIVTTALLADLESLREQGLCPDFVVFSGDLVYAGDDPEQFERAESQLIVPLLKLLALSNHEFFIVPGNHDIERSKMGLLNRV